jgi:predicted Fe-Mo cluster-binding NifX family protein
MRIAIPVTDGRLSAHFGHCEVFTLFDVDQEAGTILGRTDATPPPHEPGVLPAWLAEQGAELVLAGGMGGRAVQLFEQRGVRVVVGAPSLEAQAVVRAWLAGELAAGTNACDH